MGAGGGGVAAAVTKMNVLPFLSRAEQRPFKIHSANKVTLAKMSTERVVSL